MSLAIHQMYTSIGEFQRNYLFKLSIPSFPRTLADFLGNFNYAKDSMDLYLTKGIFPNQKTNPIQVYWAGEFVYYSGRDESTKLGDLTFRLDQGMKIKDFWEAAKQLTGDLFNHAAAPKPLQTMTLIVDMVNVGKRLITESRELVNVMVYSVDTINLDKEGSEIATFTVNISWDHAIPRFDRRNKPIDEVKPFTLSGEGSKQVSVPEDFLKNLDAVQSGDSNVAGTFA